MPIGCFPFTVAAFSISENTGLISIRTGSGFAATMRQISRSGYELADGARVDFRDWYRSSWRDLHVDFLTMIGPDTGILWGLSTGEIGGKYRIEPAMRIGIMQQFETAGTGTLTFSLVATIGGGLKEKPCTADYGAIGGVQKVNCRLAATPLPPKDTLLYLFDEKPQGAVRASINYQLWF